MNACYLYCWVSHPAMFSMVSSIVDHSKRIPRKQESQGDRNNVNYTLCPTYNLLRIIISGIVVIHRIYLLFLSSMFTFQSTIFVPRCFRSICTRMYVYVRRVEL